MDFLREPPLDRRAPSRWGIRLPPDMHARDVREALTLLLRSDVPPDTILRIFQAFGVVFEDKTLFIDKVEAYRIDPFRVLGIAVSLVAVIALAFVTAELALAALGRLTAIP